MDDLTRWLETQGLGPIAPPMRENDVDLALLPRLTPDDLRAQLEKS